MAFTPPKKRLLSFVLRETKFVLHSKQNKNLVYKSHPKTSTVAKKGGKNTSQNLKKSGKKSS
jgi:hypothetical protein